MRDNLFYNFRLAPEAVWLVVNTVIGAILIDLLGRLAGLDAFPTLDTLAAWGSALGVAALRTTIAALLAAATGGGFQAPGEPGPKPEPEIDGPVAG